jgi:hypothetical protein
MGAGISKEQLRKAQYGRLKKIERELRAAGVACSCAKGSVGDGRNFSVSYGPALRASNGECFAPLKAFVDGAVFGSNWDADKGLALIKARYGILGQADPARAAQVETEARAAILVARIAEAVRDERPLFLHGRDGGLMPTVPCGGMAYGQVYAYPEVRDGKPFVRVGPGSQYLEFEPGYSLRRADGSVVVENQEDRKGA